MQSCFNRQKFSYMHILNWVWSEGRIVILPILGKLVRGRYLFRCTKGDLEGGVSVPPCMGPAPVANLTYAYYMFSVLV